MSLPEKKDQSPRLSSESSPPFPGWLEQTGGGEAFLKKQKSPGNKETLLTPVVSGDSSCSAGVDSPSSLSGHPMIRPPATEEPPHLRTSDPPLSPSQPPHTLPPAAVRCPSHPSSSPSSPHGPLTSHVLTHLIEGFVIQEGLEPFPVILSGTLHLLYC